MLTSDATVSMSWVNTLLLAAERLGLPRERLLQRAGVRTELRADVAAFLGDARIPPREWHGSSGRSASRSLDEVARVTLRQLG